MADLLSPPQNPEPPKTGVSKNVVTAAKGGGIVFGGKLFTFASRFVTAIILANLLGAEEYGLYNLGLMAATVAGGLALLGLKQALVRYVALYDNRKDQAGLWGTLQVTLGLSIFVSLLIGVCLYIYAEPLSVKVFDEPKLIPLLRFVSIFIPFLALNDIIAAATRGFKNMKYTTITQDIVQPLMRLILTVGLAFVGLNAILGLGIYGFTVVFTAIQLLYYLNKQFSLRRPINSARREYKEIINFSYPIYLADLISTFGGNIRTVLLGAFSTIAKVGIFAIATQLNQVGNVFHLAIVTVSMPIVSELYDNQDREQLSRFYQTMTKWTFTLNLPFFLIIVFFSESLLSIFGKSFVDGAAALSVLAWANLINTGTGICGVLLDMSGRTSIKLVNSIVAFSSNIILNILLIPRWGLMGAATAALASTVITNVLRLLQVYIIFRLLPYNMSFIKPILAGLLAVGVIWILPTSFPSEINLIYTIISIGILIIVYGAGVFLLGLSDEDHALLTRLQRKAGPMLLRRK
jgi:O-antigen/teichoic acid export membrane protein